MMEPLITFKRTDAGDLVVVRMRNISQVRVEGPFNLQRKEYETLMTLNLGSVVFNRQINQVLHRLMDVKCINVELTD